MAQEFRTFTQRVTDKENSATKIFNVQAKTLVDEFGKDIVDSDGKKIWFPVTFNPADAIAFGTSLASKPKVVAYFDLRRNLWQGGPWDLQRSYNGQSNAPFAEVFTRAASYALGLIGAAAGFPQTYLMIGGGLHNLIVNRETAGWNFGNNPRNPPFIEQGFRDYFVSRFAPPAVIPSDVLQRNPMFAAPADRFDASFNGGANSSLDNFYRLAASVANGNITPTAGFPDGLAGSSLPAVLSKVTGTPSIPSRWFDAMVRNGEIERMMRNGGVVPPPTWGAVTTTPAFQPDAVYSPDGNFIGNFPTAFPSAAQPAEVTGQYGTGSGSQISADKNGSLASNAAENRRYLSRRTAGQSRGSVFDEGAPAVPSVPPNEVLSSDRPSSIENRFGNWTASPAGITARNPNLPLPSAGSGRPSGVFSGKPMPLWTTPPPVQGSRDFSEVPGVGTKRMRYVSRQDGKPPLASAFDTVAPAAPFVLPDQLNSVGAAADWAAALAGFGSLDPKRASSPIRQNAFVSENDALPRAAGGSKSSSMRPQGPTSSTLLEYIRHLNQLDANNPRVSVFDPGAPATPIAPSDDSNPMGGLAGRIAALTGFDPDNPDAPPPGGLFALLLAAQQR